MDNQIILRVRCSQGQYRISVKSSDCFGKILQKLSVKLEYQISDLIVQTQDAKPLNEKEDKIISQIPYLKDGAILKVEFKTSKKKQSHQSKKSQIKTSHLSTKCDHPPGGKCIHCVINQNQNKKQMETSKLKFKCNHGPGTRCFNCTNSDENSKQTTMKWLCQHGSNTKCMHCLDKEFISEIAHISFDQYLDQKKLKCKGVHSAEMKCANCLPPSQLRYQLDRSCTNHQPYPKGMCNKCSPPNVVIKRQQYRHVDYVEFMNVQALASFVRYWVQNKQTAEQRVGFLYGYYAEDPHYKGGIRAIVEAVYEPKQKGNYDSFEIIESEKDLNKIDKLAEEGLGLQKIGWIYTQTNHDVVMSQQKVRIAAQYQRLNQVQHSSGYMISNFITVIMKNDDKNYGEVKPEVFMISDQGQAIQSYNLFKETDSRKLMHTRAPKNANEALPDFMSQGKPVSSFQPEFLLVKIGHGSSKSNKFAYLKRAEFPAKNQQGAKRRDLKEYLKRNKNQPINTKYADFNLLICLSQLIDMETAISLAKCVQHEIAQEKKLDDLVIHKSER